MTSTQYASLLGLGCKLLSMSHDEFPRCYEDKEC
jgi:hypothetical protein